MNELKELIKIKENEINGFVDEIINLNKTINGFENDIINLNKIIINKKNEIILLKDQIGKFDDIENIDLIDSLNNEKEDLIQLIDEKELIINKFTEKSIIDSEKFDVLNEKLCNLLDDNYVNKENNLLKLSVDEKNNTINNLNEEINVLKLIINEKDKTINLLKNGDE